MVQMDMVQEDVSTLVQTGPALAVALVLLALAAAAVSRYACLGHDRAVLVASARAVVQLSLVSLALLAVVRSLSLRCCSSPPCTASRRGRRGGAS